MKNKLIVRMKNKFIVKKIFQSVPNYKRRFDKRNLLLINVDDDGNLIFEDGQNEIMVAFEVMIFSHEFCKEFFGTELTKNKKIEIWKIHIKKLALIKPKDRLKYFIPFLEISQMAKS